MRMIHQILICKHRFRYTKKFSLKLLIFSYPSVLAYVLGAQKNRLIETVLLSTNNICFGLNKKIVFLLHTFRETMAKSSG